MVAGPEQCRRYAARCMDLAREARTPSVRAQLEDLAHQWRQIASEIEKYREQIDELGLSPRPPRQIQAADFDGRRRSQCLA
jgi:hypothetical protein